MQQPESLARSRPEESRGAHLLEEAWFQGARLLVAHSLEWVQRVRGCRAKFTGPPSTSRGGGGMTQNISKKKKTPTSLRCTFAPSHASPSSHDQVLYHTWRIYGFNEGISVLIPFH